MSFCSILFLSSVAPPCGASHVAATSPPGLEFESFESAFEKRVQIWMYLTFILYSNQKNVFFSFHFFSIFSALDLSALFCLLSLAPLETQPSAHTIAEARFCCKDLLRINQQKSNVKRVKATFKGSFA